MKDYFVIMTATGPSQIFAPYRAIGLCSNHIPLVARNQGAETFLVTAVGNAFHVYLCDKLRLIFVGSPQPHPLQCLALQGKIVFASYKNTIKAFRRGQEVNLYQGHEGEVHTLLPFGEHLVAIDDQNCLKIWNIIEGELYGEIQFSGCIFSISCALHPSTYLNKILLGSCQGELQLWNIRTSTLVYSFGGWGSKVTSLAQSQAVDIVGIGLGNGNVMVHNLKYDETVMQFQQDWGPVAAISFRTDIHHTMATSSLVGHIAVWNLDRQCLGTVLRQAHQGVVTGLHFIQSQPLLLTSGPDNTVKMWIFDQSDGSARLLRSRCGHNAPPTRIRFCSTGGDAVKILSGGLDNALRVFGLHKDVQMNTELSQGSLMKRSHARGVMVEELKRPPVIDFASETSRSRDWDGVVSCHAQHKSAFTWSLQTCSIGKHALVSKHAAQGARPQCVALSGCGHFAVLGMSSGHVELYNMQSGLHRGEFGRPRAHIKAVRGVAVDALTMEVYTGSSDKTIKFWSFPTKALLHTIKLDSPVGFIQIHRDSSILCVVCDDFTIIILDTDTRRIIRKFQGHSNRITDVGFTPDGRWLISSAMDCTIRTWDLPTGRLVDAFRVETPPTSIALSPSGDFLCSTHVDDLGIYLWSNRTLYSHVSLSPLPADHTPSLFELPSAALSSEEEANKKEEEGDDDVTDPTTVAKEMYDGGDIISQGDIMEEEVFPLSDGLVTFSLLPKSRWCNLQHLDIIKQRNKPVQPPKQPKKLPFFLPTLPGIQQPKFVSAANDGEDEMMMMVAALDGSGSKILNLGKLVPLSEFQSCLRSCVAEGNYDKLMKLIKTLPPAGIEGELRSLAPENGGSLEWLEHFMQFILSQLKTKMNFELVEAYMGLFLKFHSGTLSSSTPLLILAKDILDTHTDTWNQLQSDLDTSACLLGYFRSATV